MKLWIEPSTYSEALHMKHKEIWRPSVMHHYYIIFISQYHTCGNAALRRDTYLFSGRNTIRHVITLMSRYILSLWFLSVRMIAYSKKYIITSEQSLLFQCQTNVIIYLWWIHPYSPENVRMFDSKLYVYAGNGSYILWLYWFAILVGNDCKCRIIFQQNATVCKSLPTPYFT